MDHTVKVSVWDWDRTTSDDLIGETSIDLENRIFTNHRANCGLAATYNELKNKRKTIQKIMVLRCRSGYCAWRDRHTPTHILDNLCKKFKLSSPEYGETSVRIGFKVFTPNTPLRKFLYCFDTEFCSYSVQ